MEATIKLPEGHKWVEDLTSSGSENWFQCSVCGATFIHDMIDNSQRFEDGDGSCNETASEL
jgi:hypothetical protein